MLEALAGDRIEPFVALLLATGLRRGEALGLHWSDIDFDKGTLSVRGQYQRIDGEWTWVEPKTETSARTLALPAFALAALRVQRTRQLEERLVVGSLWEDRDLVFSTVTGSPQDGDSVTHQFAKRVRRANEREKREGRAELPPITLHGLRHSAATMLLAHGLTLGEVQKVLGHSQIALTADLYTQFAPEIAQRAAGTMEEILGTGTG